jgi:hypothetical protein
MASDLNETVKIDGVEYNFQLLSLKDALKIEAQVIGLISAVMGKAEVDYDILYEIGKKICAGLLVDDFEVTDIDGYFKGKALLFNKVIMQGLKINFPDFFSELNKLGSDSAIKQALSKSGIKV